jgi:hypothetical protein
VQTKTLRCVVVEQISECTCIQGGKADGLVASTGRRRGCRVASDFLYADNTDAALMLPVIVPPS